MVKWIAPVVALAAWFGAANVLAAGVDDLAAARNALAAYKYDDAVAKFTAALSDRALAPQDAADAHAGRGRAHYLKLEFGPALADENQAIRIAPGDGGAYAEKAAAELSLGNRTGALADANKAIALAPSGVLGYVVRGAVYRETNAVDLALADYDTAERLKPDEPRIFIGRGYVYLLQQKWDLTIAQAARAEGLNAAPGYADYLRGLALEGKGDLDEAKRSLDRAVDAVPWAAGFVLSRGDLDLRQRRADRALDDATRAIAIDPKLGQAYVARASAYYDKGEFASAVDDMQQAANLSPKNQSIAKALASMSARRAARNVSDYMVSALYPARVAMVELNYPLDLVHRAVFGSWTIQFGSDPPLAEFNMAPQRQHLSIGGFRCANSVAGTVSCGIGVNVNLKTGSRACSLNIATKPAPQAPIAIVCPTSLWLAP